MVYIPTCDLQLKMKSVTEGPFLLCKLFVKIKNMPLLPTVNKPLVEFIHILGDIYHLPMSVVVSTHSLKDTSGYAQVNANCTLN